MSAPDETQNSDSPSVQEREVSAEVSPSETTAADALESLVNQMQDSPSDEKEAAATERKEEPVEEKVDAQPDQVEADAQTEEDPLALLPSVLRAAMEKKGYLKMTGVQQSVAQAAEKHRDLRISSQTGSGKTVAIGIALGGALIDDGPRPGAESKKRSQKLGGPTALVLAPTRELAIQVQRELVWLLAGIEDASVEVVTGGTSVGLDRKHLSYCPRIVVGTPGRVLDHLKSNVIDPSKIGHVILDEADQMLDMGFRDELDGILGFLPDERHTHLVSATFSGEVLRVAQAFQKDPLHLEGTALGQANADIQHIAHVIPGRARFDALLNVLLLSKAEFTGQEGGRTLVFVRTRADTSELAERLGREGFSAEALSGDLAQSQRIRTLDAFRSGRVDILVATDVAARGIDVKGIDCVIHFEPPQNVDAFVHRSGRTGRAGQQGKSLIFLPPQARGRVERMMRSAQVKARFAPVPTAEKIKKAYSKIARRRLYQAFEKPAEQPMLEQAKKLLEETEAVEVISRLLAMIDEEPPCRPRDVATVPEGGLHADRAGYQGRRGGKGSRGHGHPRGDSNGFRGGRGRDDRGPRGPRPPRGGGHFSQTEQHRERGDSRGPREGEGSFRGQGGSRGHANAEGGRGHFERRESFADQSGRPFRGGPRPFSGSQGQDGGYRGSGGKGQPSRSHFDGPSRSDFRGGPRGERGRGAPSHFDERGGSRFSGKKRGGFKR